jgi:nucleotide sugar dehydrogenase
VCCTTLPGYCDNLAGRVAPLGYSVSYKPEFIAQGTIMRDMQYPDMALIGTHNPRAEEKIRAIYGRIYKKKPEIHVMDRLSAEICKLATNCFLTTKISFANSIGDLAWRAGADPGKILAAIGGDTRIGPKYLAYGDGFGGPCFPRDNRALLHFSRLHDMFLHLSHSTDEVNRQHLEFQVGRYLKQYEPHDTIEFDWVTYKKESVSLEESQRLALCIRLAESGRKVLIRERPEVVDALRRKYGGLFTYETRYED